MTRETRTEFQEPPSGDEDVGLTTADYHEVLSVPRRRVALDVLSDVEDAVWLDELAEAVATREGDPPRGTDQVAIELHHNHLPRMDHLGLVEYDPETNRVTVTQLPQL